MPNQHAPMTDKLLKEALGFYTAAAGNVTRAAKLAGLTRPTFKDRLSRARAKFGSTTIVPEDKGAARRAQDSRELDQLRKENVLLRSALTNKAAVKPQKLPKAKTRSGKDDTIRVIMPDSHAQHIDTAAFAAFLADVKLLDPDEFVGLGDHVDAGGFLAQHHTMGYVAQLDECSWEQDLAAWESQLNALQAAAGRAKFTILAGNHCVRPEKWAVQQSLGNQRDAEMLKRAVAPEYRLDYAGRGIDFVEYGEQREGVPVRGAVRLGKCYFTHGFALGKDAARNHALKFGAPVVYGHTHTPAAYFGKTVHGGVHAAWNFGCLCKLAPRYMHNNPDNWAHGYGLQLVARSGLFTTIHVPIIKGQSFLPTAFK